MVTQVGLSREVGGRKGFMVDWLALLAETRPVFIGIPFRDASATLKTS
jgi:hypothetical protein